MFKHSLDFFIFLSLIKPFLIELRETVFRGNIYLGNVTMQFRTQRYEEVLRGEMKFYEILLIMIQEWDVKRFQFS